MKRKGLWITLAVAAVVLLMLGSSYNGMVTGRETVKSRWGEVQTQLQRRGDLIPNLVNTVKGYAAHEQQVFSDIADARARLMGAGSVAEAEAANAQLTGALGRLLAISESYPELKANTNFIQLQDELAGTENRIQRSRAVYNESVTGYNLKIRRFPANMVAGIFGFAPVDYFEADAGTQQVPNVSF